MVEELAKTVGTKGGSGFTLQSGPLDLTVYAALTAKAVGTSQSAQTGHEVFFFMSVLL